METAEKQEKLRYRKIQEYELFHDGKLGRCTSCGRLIMLPCLACQLENVPLKEEDELVISQHNISLELQLTGSYKRRYEQVRAYREQYGIPLFGNEVEEEIVES
jgi:hypothetical protein